MSRVCPRCSESFEDRWYCPTCGVRLAAEGSSGGPAAIEREPSRPAAEPVRRPPPSRVASTLSRLFTGKGGRWQHTTWGKCLIGLILAQGLYYALAQMAYGVLMIFGDAGAIWGSLSGLLIKQLLQGLGIVAGGIVAGAGQRRAVRNGTVVGLYNGLLFLMVDALLGTPNLMALIGQPLLHVAFGTLGGYLGRRIWQPALPILTARMADVGGHGGLDGGDWGESNEREGQVQLNTAGLNPIPLPEPWRKPNPFAGQIYWVRVVLGVVIVVAGTVFAQTILNRYLLSIEGMELGFDTPRQAQFITWEISVLAMIFGGAFAGANTFNGPLQGTIVGILGATILIARVFQPGGDESAAQTLGFVVLGIELGTTTMQIVGTLFSVIPLSIAGGWFGGQLLPPILPPRVISRTYTAPV